MLRIGGDGAQCLRRRPEQDVINQKAMTSISAGTVNTTWK
jgi:hypothetical protein